MTTFKTPGVYIQEKNAFPSSIVGVETAVPVFIGYTQTAVRQGKGLLGIPARISSFAEYMEYFGGAFTPRFNISKVNNAKGNLTIDGIPYEISQQPDNIAYMFNSLRFFYANGGSICYIISVGTYGTNTALNISIDDFISTDTSRNVFSILEKEFEPTLVIIPDIIAKGKEAYSVYQRALEHCNKTQKRFAIFDLSNPSQDQTTEEVVNEFQNGIGNNFLDYGAAYYPWLKTNIVSKTEIGYQNIDSTTDLASILPEPAAIATIRKFNSLNIDEKEKNKSNFENELRNTSKTYNDIINEIVDQLNILPPSGAMAGIYTFIDNARGVWKAPANISVADVIAPLKNISNQEQQELNVPLNGKAVNVIRPFPNIGTLVWGARTLDGNNQDYRYINVRRTLIMIEQSIKLGTQAYVFEPNDANTWITVKNTISNFLFNLWEQGALAGSKPEEAYDVQVGLGSTMTANDILDGLMNVSVKLAIVRPAEFIVFNFQLQMAT